MLHNLNSLLGTFSNDGIGSDRLSLFAKMKVKVDGNLAVCSHFDLEKRRLSVLEAHLLIANGHNTLRVVEDHRVSFDARPAPGEE